ncbi:Rho GTPase-activating protein 27 [Nowakowskiella sp. JEL0407]|nr:Rho GTPase-activating protein 27 [Nowakowskiella sp. JEL0407]
MTGLVRYVAIWDYAAIESNEISFSAGDELFMVDECNQDWWSATTKENITGYFPANRVNKVVLENSSDSDHPPATTEPTNIPTDSWVEHTNEFGEIYYWNSETNETTWDNPYASDRPVFTQDSGNNSVAEEKKEILQLPQTFEQQHEISPFDSPLDPIPPADTSNQFAQLDQSLSHLTTSNTPDPLSTHAESAFENLDTTPQQLSTLESETSLASKHSTFFRDDLDPSSYDVDVTKDVANLTLETSENVAAAEEESVIPDNSPSAINTSISAVVKESPNIASPNSTSFGEVEANIQDISTIPPEFIRREGFVSIKIPPSKNWKPYWGILTLGFLFCYKDQLNSNTNTTPSSSFLQLPSMNKQKQKRSGNDESVPTITPPPPAFVICLKNVSVEKGVEVVKKKNISMVVIKSKAGETWNVDGDDGWMESVLDAMVVSEPDCAAFENVKASIFKPQEKTAINTPNLKRSAPKYKKNSISVDRDAATTPPPQTSTQLQPSASNQAIADEDETKRSRVIMKLGGFFKTRPSVEKLKEKGIIPANTDLVFGGDLETQCKREGRDIPKIIELCTKEVEERARFFTEEDLKLHEELDINVVAALLKRMFFILFFFYA